MKSIPLFLILISLSFSNYAQQTINWMTWDEMIVQRDKDSIKKKIFIDLYTGWCGWCKKMDQTTFIDPAVVQYMNDHYYAVKLDAEMRDTINFNGHQFTNSEPSFIKTHESARGRTHWFAYSLLDGAMSFPTYAMLDENFTRLVVYPGYKTQEELMGILVFFGSNQYQVYHNFLNNQWNTLLKQNQGK
jgi:thioredoxin-related protein